jgi:hypothetical protein
LDRDIAAWGEALGLFVEAAEERSCYSDGEGGERKSAENEAEACVNGEVEYLVIG